MPTRLKRSGKCLSESGKSMVFCNSCGAEMQPTMRTCPGCGITDSLIGGLRSIAVPELSGEVAYYVVSYYWYLMNDTERKAQRHLRGAMKATLGSSDDAAQREAKNHRVYFRMLSDDPDVLLLAKDGYGEFSLRTTARILRDSADKVFFNLCPRCSKLTRTPRARQCWHCGHDWHAPQRPAGASGDY